MGESTAHARAAQDDSAIARLVAGGDRAAFELLMRRYNRRLHRLARASLSDEAEARDAVQDAYLCAYRSMRQFRGHSALSTWLSRIVLNECLARKRRDTRRQNIISIVSWESSLERVADVADSADGPESALARAQMRSVLERKVSELPEIFRVVFVMRSVEDMSVEETAQCLDIPEDTVRSRHFRAKGLLRESLAKDVDVAEQDIFAFEGVDCDGIVANVLRQLDSLGD